jgi:hypothetical protein
MRNIRFISFLSLAPSNASLLVRADEFVASVKATANARIFSFMFFPLTSPGQQMKGRGPDAPSSEAPRSAFHKQPAKPRRVARAWNARVKKIRGFLMSQQPKLRKLVLCLGYMHFLSERFRLNQNPPRRASDVFLYFKAK